MRNDDNVEIDDAGNVTPEGSDEDLGNVYQEYEK